LEILHSPHRVQEDIAVFLGQKGSSMLVICVSWLSDFNARQDLTLETLGGTNWHFETVIIPRQNLWQLCNVLRYPLWLVFIRLPMNMLVTRPADKLVRN